MEISDYIYLLDYINPEKINNSNIEKYYEKTLQYVLVYLKYKKISIINNNKIFEWKIKIKDRNISLIMDFSEPPRYDLLLITHLENNNRILADYINYSKKIHLDEKVIDIFEKIDIFLEYIYESII